MAAARRFARQLGPIPAAGARPSRFREPKGKYIPPPICGPASGYLLAGPEARTQRRFQGQLRPGWARQRRRRLQDNLGVAAGVGAHGQLAGRRRYGPVETEIISEVGAAGRSTFSRDDKLYEVTFQGATATLSGATHVAFKCDVPYAVMDTRLVAVASDGTEHATG